MATVFMINTLYLTEIITKDIIYYNIICELSCAWLSVAVCMYVCVRARACIKNYVIVT